MAVEKAIEKSARWLGIDSLNSLKDEQKFAATTSMQGKKHFNLFAYRIWKVPYKHYFHKKIT